MVSNNKYVKDNEYFEKVFMDLLIYNPSNKSYDINKEKINFELDNVKQIIFMKNPNDAKLGDIIQNLYCNAQKYMVCFISFDILYLYCQRVW